jgi:hypothetical protein
MIQAIPLYKVVNVKVAVHDEIANVLAKAPWELLVCSIDSSRCIRFVSNIRFTFISILIGPQGFPGIPGDRGLKGPGGRQGNAGLVGEKGDRGQYGNKGERV